MRREGGGWRRESGRREGEGGRREGETGPGDAMSPSLQLFRYSLSERSGHVLADLHLDDILLKQVHKRQELVLLRKNKTKLVLHHKINIMYISGIASSLGLFKNSIKNRC